MALGINVTGMVQILTGTGAAGALEEFAISLDKPRFTIEPYYYDVFTDEHGGPQGPIRDTQFLGLTIRGQLEVSKFDRAVLGRIRQRGQVSTTEGKVEAGDIGKLMFGNGRSIRILLLSDGDPYNFPRCIIREDDFDPGTKHAIPRLTFIAHRDDNDIVYDGSIDGVPTP